MTEATKPETPFRAVDFIAQKRDGGEHTAAEIEEWIRASGDGRVTDYQLSAWLMAVYLRGMTEAETVALTRAMATSGRTLDLGALRARSVDKHSTGGVGDKVSLVAVPIAAAAGVVVPKMSGRGLGMTGGTLDKLESIPGFQVARAGPDLRRQLAEVGCVIASQTADLAPADGRLYALRDVTATVDSLPLIVSSILSKKLAGGAPAIVLDVKAGSGAFMPTVSAAEALAQALVRVGQACGRRVVAWVTQMDQPLGQAVGNAIEVREAIAVLAGTGPADVRALALGLAAEMIHLAGRARSIDEATALAERVLTSGTALAKLGQLIAVQGGDARVVAEPDRLPQAPIRHPIRAPHAGYVARLDAGAVGRTLNALGAGRQRKGDPIDLRIGATFHAKVGDRVAAGDLLVTLHLADASQAAHAATEIQAAYGWSDALVNPLPVRLARIAC